MKLTIDVSGSVAMRRGAGSVSSNRLSLPFSATVWKVLAHATTGGTCPTPPGEWISAKIQVETSLLAQYAMAHYLEQDRVLDADVVA